MGFMPPKPGFCYAVHLRVMDQKEWVIDSGENIRKRSDNHHMHPEMQVGLAVETFSVALEQPRERVAQFVSVEESAM